MGATGEALGPLGAVTPGPAGAWILTSALRVGLARYVGQAVRDHSPASTSTKARVVAIGITSLGRVLHRRLLDDAQVSVWLGALWPWDTVGLGGPRISATPRGRGACLMEATKAASQLTTALHLRLSPPTVDRPAVDTPAPDLGGSRAWVGGGSEAALKD